MKYLGFTDNGEQYRVPSDISAWFNCAKCGKEVRVTEWISLCNACGEEEEARGQSMTTDTVKGAASISPKVWACDNCDVEGTEEELQRNHTCRSGSTTLETEKSPKEIARNMVARWKADIGQVVKYERLEADIEKALRDRDARAAKIAKSAFADEGWSSHYKNAAIAIASAIGGESNG